MSSSHTPEAEDATQHMGKLGAQSRNKTEPSSGSSTPGLSHFIHCPRLINSHTPLGICQCQESRTNLAPSISPSQKPMFSKPNRSQKLPLGKGWEPSIVLLPLLCLNIPIPKEALFVSPQPLGKAGFVGLIMQVFSSSLPCCSVPSERASKLKH